MKQLFLQLLPVFFFSPFVYSQVETERFLISPWGATSETWSATLGEPIIGLMNGEVDLVVGMQQPSGNILTSNISVGSEILELMAYPNPTMDWLHIDLSAATPKDLQMILISSLGYRISQAQLRKGSSTVRLDLSDVPAGTYRLIIKNSNNNLISTANIQKI